MVRCFIGIFIPENLKEKIVNVQNQIKKIGAECKFVEVENLHLCLSFLGEVEEIEIEKISSKLDEICSRYKKFDVNISGIKIIPSESYIRVLVLNVFNVLLETISKNIKNEIGGDVKPPHLTLCRVKNIKNKQNFVEELKTIDYVIGNFTVKSIHLIKSELRKSGPVYTSLHESRLL